MEPPDRALVEDRGVHRGRADGGDADAVRGRLGAQRQRQPDHRVLGHDVRRQQPGRHQPAHRGGVDDVAAALADHQRVRRVHAVHDAADVDVDDRVPVVEGELLGLAADADAGVVEQQVERRRARRPPTSTSAATPGAEVTSSAHGPGACPAGARTRPSSRPPRGRGRRRRRGRPAETSARESAAPMPEPAPVTIAERPANRSRTSTRPTRPASRRPVGRWPGRGSGVDRRGPDQPAGLLLLEDVRRPAAGAGTGEHRGEHVRGDLGEVEDDRGPELDVGLQHPVGPTGPQLGQRRLLERLGHLVARRVELARRYGGARGRAGPRRGRRGGRSPSAARRGRAAP